MSWSWYNPFTWVSTPASSLYEEQAKILWAQVERVNNGLSTGDYTAGQAQELLASIVETLGFVPKSYDEVRDALMKRHDKMADDVVMESVNDVAKVFNEVGGNLATAAKDGTQGLASVSGLIGRILPFAALGIGLLIVFAWLAPSLAPRLKKAAKAVKK